ncbi:hypothetical protein [Herbiconiux sp. VKM Ac-2851]|uniref:hypothetical protein n=1 Tax=Herbiconiux sp. VKM Ac-2851 TaxID=2739025 RepID=UPI0015649024|nr:hypothetical protein [Herbiconiux sp. VKM Ac-2851]NQX36432.1 hypothetical protein [Herbiconiux sp. VKM Ac-2851]
MSIFPHEVMESGDESWPDPAVIPSLVKVIRDERLAAYATACHGDAARSIRLYTWNIEASAALLNAFAPLEVGIRNAMHNSLVQHFQRTDWWNAASLSRADRAQIDSAIDYLDRRKGQGRWTAGHVVAELKVSFWEGLLVNRYHAALWEPALQKAFPHSPARRGDIRAQLERLRLLRNRAAHHEPIHARDLTVDHRYMCELAGHISPQLETWIAGHSRLPRTVADLVPTLDGTRPGQF